MGRILALSCLPSVYSRPQGPLDFLHDLSDYEQMGHLSPDALNARAFELLDQRAAETANLRTAADVEQHGRGVRPNSPRRAHRGRRWSRIQSARRASRSPSWKGEGAYQEASMAYARARTGDAFYVSHAAP